MISSCRDYHEHTSYDRHRMGGHSLDWSNQPNVFKEYPGLKLVPLPVAAPAPETGLSKIVLGDPVGEPPASIALEQLSQVLSLAYRLTVRSLHPGGESFYRNVPSAGALYPCELYVAARAIAGLENGLYHYPIGLHGLTQLRSEDCYEGLDCGPQPDRAEQTSFLTFFITAILFRSAWKYRARSYRYHLMDSGHLVESLVLGLKALSLPCQVIFDFADEAINSFLGYDTEREVCLAIVTVGGKRPPMVARGKPFAELPEAARAASRVARKEVVYPALQQFHAAATRVMAPQGDPPAMIREVAELPSSWEEVPEPEVWPETIAYSEAVGRRRSHRNFIKEPIPQATFQALVTLLSADSEAPGSLSHFQQQTVALGFLAGNVEGLDRGCYWLDRGSHRLGLSRSGEFTARMAHVCLDQEWLAQAGLHFFFATNLELLEATWGPRGYRYAMLTAGRLGQRIYLAATSLELGCCGIGAFYDGEAASLLGLNDASVMLYLLGVGAVKRVIIS